jgi:hypothetical protein
MRGFHNGSFDPPTFVVLEAAFDEAWLTLKSIGNTTVKPDELAARLRLAIEGERDPVQLHDGAGARRVDDLACPEVHRGRFPAVFLDLELDLLTFIERAQSGALDGGDMHKDIPASTCGLNETIALLRVEPLHRSARHCRFSKSGIRN